MTIIFLISEDQYHPSIFSNLFIVSLLNFPSFLNLRKFSANIPSFATSLSLADAVGSFLLFFAHNIIKISKFS